MPHTATSRVPHTARFSAALHTAGAPPFCPSTTGPSLLRLDAALPLRAEKMYSAASGAAEQTRPYRRERVSECVYPTDLRSAAQTGSSLMPPSGSSARRAGSSKPPPSGAPLSKASERETTTTATSQSSPEARGCVPEAQGKGAAGLTTPLGKAERERGPEATEEHCWLFAPARSRGEAAKHSGGDSGGLAFPSLTALSPGRLALNLPASRSVARRCGDITRAGRSPACRAPAHTRVLPTLPARSALSPLLSAKRHAHVARGAAPPRGAPPSR